MAIKQSTPAVPIQSPTRLQGSRKASRSSLPARGTGQGRDKPGLDLTIDLIDGADLQVTDRGVRVTRVMHVSGLRNQDDMTLYMALFAKGMPQYGMPHPSIPGIFVSNIQSRPDGSCNTKARVTVTYGAPETDSYNFFDNYPDEDQTPSIEVTSTIQAKRTNRHMGREEKEPITVTRNWLVPAGEGPPQAMSEEQGAEVEYMEPQLMVRYRRRENQSPGNNARHFVGKVNSTSVFGDPPRFWMCTRIDGISDDGGQTYNVTYEFQRNRDTWDAVVVAIDPATGKPQVSPVPNPGGDVVLVTLYEEIDFTALHLTVF